MIVTVPVSAHVCRAMCFKTLTTRCEYFVRRMNIFTTRSEYIDDAWLFHRRTNINFTTLWPVLVRRMNISSFPAPYQFNVHNAPAKFVRRMVPISPSFVCRTNITLASVANISCGICIYSQRASNILTTRDFNCTNIQYIEYFYIQRVLLNKASTYSMQRVPTLCTRVLTLCNEYLLYIQEYLLYTTNTYYIRVLTLYNEYLLYTSTYSIQRVLIIYNEYLLYTTSTPYNEYLLYATSTRILYIEYFYIQRVLLNKTITYSIQRVIYSMQRVLYSTQLYSMQRVLLHTTSTSIYNEYLLYIRIKLTY